MFLGIFLIAIIIITIVFPLLRKPIGVENFENDTKDNNNDKEDTSLLRKEEYIDLIDEFKRLRYLLDTYDTESVSKPYDCNLQKRRSTLEHLLTSIVIYVQEYGHKAPVDDVMELMKSVNLQVQPQMLSPETTKMVLKK